MFLTMLRKRKEKKELSCEDKIEAAFKIAKATSMYNRCGGMSNEQNVHRMVCDMAGGCKRSDKNLLYMKFDQNADSLYIQSDTPLNKEKVESLGYEFVHDPICLDDKLKNLKKGSIVTFRAKLAPTERSSATRVTHSLANVQDGEEKRNEWLARNAVNNGFRIKEIYEGPSTHITWDKSDSKKRTHTSWTNAFYYAGEIEITDPDVFLEAVKKGIGKYKAYGCGLFLISNEVA